MADNPINQVLRKLSMVEGTIDEVSGSIEEWLKTATPPDPEEETGPSRKCLRCGMTYGYGYMGTTESYCSPQCAATGLIVPMSNLMRPGD